MTSGRFGRGRSVGPTCSRRRPGAATSIARSWAAVRCGPGPIALVDDDDVGDLEQAGLDRLDLVAHLGRFEDDGRVGRRGDLDLALAGPDRLDEDEVEADRVEDRAGRPGRRGQPAGVAAGGHRPDEHVAVAGVGLHPDPVAEDRPAGDRARRVDRDDRDRPAGPPDLGDERRDERRLAGAGRPGDPDEVGPAGARVEPAEGDLGDRGPVLDRGQEPGERAAIAGQRRVGELRPAPSRVRRPP